MTDKISFQDYLQITNLASQWSTSYDTKDWEALKTILAPTSFLDFRSLQGEFHENLSPDDYAAILAKMIGDERLKTQHLMGATTWAYQEEEGGAVEVVHQMRVAHQRYTDESLAEVVNKGHAHGFVVHRYKKYGGEWKIESVRPKLEWTEYDLYGTLSPPETEKNLAGRKWSHVALLPTWWKGVRSATSESLRKPSHKIKVLPRADLDVIRVTPAVEMNLSTLTITAFEMARTFTLDDYIEVNSLVFDWCQSYTNRNWGFLAHCLAPSSELNIWAKRYTNLSPLDHAKVLESAREDELQEAQPLLGIRKLAYGNSNIILDMHQMLPRQLGGDPEAKGPGDGILHFEYENCRGRWKIKSVFTGLQRMGPPTDDGSSEGAFSPSEISVETPP